MEILIAWPRRRSVGSPRWTRLLLRRRKCPPSASTALLPRRILLLELSCWRSLIHPRRSLRRTITIVSAVRRRERTPSTSAPLLRTRILLLELPCWRSLIHPRRSLRRTIAIVSAVRRREAVPSRSNATLLGRTIEPAILSRWCPVQWARVAIREWPRRLCVSVPLHRRSGWQP